MLVCGICQQPKRSSGGGWCMTCGVSCWCFVQDAPPPLPDGVQVRGLDDVPALVTVPFRGMLSEALSGLVLGGTVLVYGPAGSGKSTLAAELGSAMALASGSFLWWLDQEQLDERLINACFTRTDSPTDRAKIVSPLPPTDPRYRAITASQFLFCS